MRGLIVTALLAPVLTSALVVPNTWDDVDRRPYASAGAFSELGIYIPLSGVDSLDPSSHSFYIAVDLTRSVPECGSGELIINNTPTPYGVTGELELTKYQKQGLWSIETKWKLSCGPTMRTLVFSVDRINKQPVTDIGISIDYSQDRTSLNILSYTRFSRNPKAVATEFLSDKTHPENRLNNEEDQKPEVVPAMQGTQTTIAEEPRTDDVDAVLSITVCDTVKCVFMVAFHHTKETAKHVKSKAKTLFGCHRKHRGSHPRKCASSPGRQHHGDADAGDTPATVGHSPANPKHCPQDAFSKHRHRVHGHHVHWRHVNKVSYLTYVFFFVLFAALTYIHCRYRRAIRAVPGGRDNNTVKKRRGCLGWRRRRCREKKREYSDKDEVLPLNEPNPAYTMPSHIATEIADLRSAAEAVEDIVSQSSEGNRYARRGSADTMETLPEYTAQETDAKMGAEELPGYTDSEESVSVADGYQPGTGEVWRARVDGVDVKS